MQHTNKIGRQKLKTISYHDHPERKETLSELRYALRFTSEAQVIRYAIEQLAAQHGIKGLFTYDERGKESEL